MMKNKFWTSEKLLTIVAILISISTLMVFIYQTNLIRKQQYLSVYPHLALGDYYTNSPNYRYVLENKGIGPALIKSLKIKDKNKIYDKNLVPYLRKMIKKEDSLHYTFAIIEEGRLISAKEKIDLIASKGGKINSNRLYKLIHRENLELIIEYESIYGERWRISSISKIPTRIK